MTPDAKDQKTESVTILEQGLAALRIRDGLEKASRLFPKTRSAVFVSRECGGDTRFDYFGDNIKYAYLSFLEYAASQGIDAWFLTDSERIHQQITAAGLPCLPWFVPHWTAEHMRIMLSAKVAVLSNIFYPSSERGYVPYALLQGARSVQLWHGIPLKAIGMEALYPPLAYTPRAAEVLGASGPFDVFVGTSAATREDWARRFAFGHYAPSGYPRTDVLFREPSARDMINVDTAALGRAATAAREGKPYILYTPTFRDGEFGTWVARADIEALADHCARRGYAFAVALHPFECGFIETYRRRYPRVDFLEPFTDIYPILRNIGVLITDYSSLVFDFLLLDRPVVFYRPDHADYIAKSRPLIPEHENYICGAVTEDIVSLTSAVDAAVSSADPYKDKRAALRRRLYDNSDGHAGERLNTLIAELME